LVPSGENEAKVTGKNMKKKRTKSEMCAAESASSVSLKVISLKVISGPARVEGNTIVMTGEGTVVIAVSDGPPLSVTYSLVDNPMLPTTPTQEMLDEITSPGYIVETRELFDKAVKAQKYEEAAKLIEDGIARTIQQKKVTYDLERLMPGATKVGTSAFATAIVANMRGTAAAK